jgi:hypothetical protein
MGYSQAESTAALDEEAADSSEANAQLESACESLKETAWTVAQANSPSLVRAGRGETLRIASFETPQACFKIVCRERSGWPTSVERIEATSDQFEETQDLVPASVTVIIKPQQRKVECLRDGNIPLELSWGCSCRLAQEVARSLRGCLSPP